MLVGYLTFARDVGTQALENGRAAFSAHAEAIEIEPVGLQRQCLLHGRNQVGIAASAVRSSQQRQHQCVTIALQRRSAARHMHPVEHVHDSLLNSQGRISQFLMEATGNKMNVAAAPAGSHQKGQHLCVQLPLEKVRACNRHFAEYCL